MNGWLSLELYAGDHRIVAALPDGRTSWVE
jgi:hypothetical protein